MKCLMQRAALLIALCYPAMGQAFDPNTPDGSMIASIQKESDASKKQAMLEEFVQKYPDSRNVGWAWSQLQAAYLQAQQYDKVIDAGQKSLASDPDAIEAASEALASWDSCSRWLGCTG